MEKDFGSTNYDLTDNIATITFNRPDKLNAFSVPALREVLAAMLEAERDDNVRVIIFTGAGKSFCAGADVSRGPNHFDYASYTSVRDELKVDGIYRDAGGLVTLRMFDCPKPIIVAINGAAVGFGATMPLAADFRLASTHAKFIYPFVQRGIVPESAASWFLPRVVGLPTALDWCITGRRISAEEALVAGLVRSVHEPEDLIPAARELAGEIAQRTAPVSVALTRQMLWRMQGAAHPMAAHQADSRGVQFCGAKADAYEGISSFLEKRAPVFSDSVTSGLPDIFPDWENPEFH